MSFLDSVNSPSDIKKLNIEQLNILCSEIRETLVNTVSKTGGHLASNLGVVELTVALHKVFNSPNDQIVFDVGHQCYTHKLLTGRRDRFSTLRCEGGISGFLRPEESEHDIMSSGHSSTSISAAIGLAKAKQLKGEKGKVIAVIGDGALTGGLAYEALNNSGMENSNLIVVLNDNNMSISKNVGSISKNLTTIRTNPKVFSLKNRIRRGLAKIPIIGDKLCRDITTISSKLRKSLYKNGTFFEDLGFRYYGPIDGHDLESLVAALNVAKEHNHSVLLHVCTTKGKGYNPAEKNPTQFHGVGQFNIETGEPNVSGDTFSSTFGETMCNFAENDSRICCVTAAMATGTGLSMFGMKYPKRLFDVGIAEQHAVTFSSGLAKNGMIPVFAVYSTFLQRSYDQLIHDVAMQKLKVIFAIDRAGFVGSDGESHQGIFDVSFLNSVPDLVIYSPTYFDEMSHDFYQAIYKDNTAVAVRYPRGNEPKKPDGYTFEKNDFQIYDDSSKEICIVTYGKEFYECAKAANELENVFVIKLNKIKPIPTQCFEHLRNCKKVYFYEEGVRTGGVGEHFGSFLLENNFDVQYEHIAVNDEFVKQATVNKQIEHYKLDYKSILDEVKND